MPVSAGDRLGPYEILSRLGEGAMGEVGKALDTRLDLSALMLANGSTAIEGCCSECLV